MFVTGDEACMHSWHTETKQQLTQWKIPFAPLPKKPMQIRSNARDMILDHFIVRMLLISNLFL